MPKPKPKYPPFLPPAPLRPVKNASHVVLGLVRSHQFFDDRPPEVYKINALDGNAILDDAGKTVATWAKTGDKNSEQEMLTVSYVKPENQGFDDHGTTERFSYWMYSALKFNLPFPRTTFRDKLAFTRELARPFISADEYKHWGKEDRRRVRMREEEDDDDTPGVCQTWQTTLKYLAYEACAPFMNDTAMLHTIFGGPFYDWDNDDKPDDVAPEVNWWVRGWNFWTEHIFLAYEERLLSHG